MKNNNDAVKYPAHYKGKTLESIDVIVAFRLGFHLANVLKYLLRHLAKNGNEDIKKAIRYLRMFERSRPAQHMQTVLWEMGGVGLGCTNFEIAADFGFTLPEHIQIASCIDLLLGMPFSGCTPERVAGIIACDLKGYLDAH